MYVDYYQTTPNLLLIKILICLLINQGMMKQSSSIRSAKVKADEYIMKEKIGRGNFGEVEKCQHKQSSKIYAVKTIEVNGINIDSIQEEAFNMSKCNSDYVLQLIDHFHDQTISAYVLVTPYYKMGSLEAIMKNDWEFEDLLLFMYQISKALFDLFNKNKILHLDLKPDNILIKGPGQYILCDLGCSRKLENSHANLTRSISVMKMSSTNARGGGTPQYASPDLVINYEMTPFSDIWSLGVILYKIIFKMHPITPINVRMLDKKINEFYNGNFQINYPQTPESKKYRPIVQLIKRMLVCSADREKRITWDEIIEEICRIEKVPAGQIEYIVTNFDLLLQFVDKVSIITSAVLYYFQQLAAHLKQSNIDTRMAVKETCIYLLTITNQLMTHTKEYHQGDFQFYLFSSTRKNLTKKQKSYAQFLQRQAERVANNCKTFIQYGVVRISRQGVVHQYGKLYKQLKKVRPPQNMISKIQFQKLSGLLDYISYKNQLKYENRKELSIFVKDFINS